MQVRKKTTIVEVVWIAVGLGSSLVTKLAAAHTVHSTRRRKQSLPVVASTSSLLTCILACSKSCCCCLSNSSSGTPNFSKRLLFRWRCLYIYNTCKFDWSEWLSRPLTYHGLLLVFPLYLLHFMDVLMETEGLQGLDDVLRRNDFLLLFLWHFAGFRRQKVNEFYQAIAKKE